MGDLLRLLALDGPVVGAGVLVALAWLIVRVESTRSENAAAHAAITRNIDGVKAQMSRDIDGVKAQTSRDIDGVKAQMSRDIDGVKAQMSRDIDGLQQQIDGVKQDVRDVKQDVRMLTAHLLNRKTDADE